jgi:hypothetical protein
MTSIASLNIASSTASNWLKEAQESLISAANPGGLLGALQAAGKNNGSVKSFLSNSQTAAANMALISMSTAQASVDLIAQMSSDAAQKRLDGKLALQQKLNAPQTNFNPPTTLDQFVYFKDGSFLDTINNILTKFDGTQIDTTTGQRYIEPGSLIQMANGAYLDTKNNILTLADGTKIDTVTHLVITA